MVLSVTTAEQDRPEFLHPCQRIRARDLEDDVEGGTDVEETQKAKQGGKPR